jgi:hypothetical protein
VTKALSHVGHSAAFSLLLVLAVPKVDFPTGPRQAAAEGDLDGFWGQA